MRPPLRAPRIVAIVLLAFFSNGVRNTVVVISATELFRRQTRTTVDHSLGQSGLNVQLSPPITPQSSNAVVELSTVRDSNLKHLEHILGNLSRLKFATEVQAHEARKNIIEAIYRIRSKNRSKCFPSVGVSRDLMSTTRLSGGAEQEQKAGNISERGDPTSTPDDNALPKNSAFLGNLETLRQRSMNLPRTIIPVIKKVKSVAKAVQSTSSRAVPPFVTTLSLIYTSKKGMSAVSLYALALLGASCGFHLFLHFITIGYALGIGVPLSVALYVYNVSEQL